MFLLVSLLVCLSVAQNTGQLSGLVQDSTGEAIPGVSLTISSQDSPLSAPRYLVSNVNGRYVANDLPFGVYTVVAEMSGFSPFRGVANVDGDVTFNIVLVLQPLNDVSPTGQISGTVEDTAGQTLPGVIITITPTNPPGFPRTYVSNALGKYVAPNLPYGQYEMTAQLSGFTPYQRLGILVRGDLSLIIRLSPQPFDAVFPGEPTIAGTVTDAFSDAPLAGATVTLTSNFGDKPSQSATTSSDGTFSFAVSDSWTVTVTCADCITQARTVFSAYGTTVANFAMIQYVSGSTGVVGSLVNEAGAPIAGAEVGVVLRYEQSRGPVAGPVITSASGKFSFSNLPGAKHYEFLAFSNGYQGAKVAFDGEADKQIILKVIMQADATATGQISGLVLSTIDLQPVMHGLVELTRQDGTFTDVSVLTWYGEYSFQNVPPGEHQLRVLASRHEVLTQSVTVGAEPILKNVKVEPLNRRGGCGRKRHGTRKRRAVLAPKR